MKTYPRVLRPAGMIDSGESIVWEHRRVRVDSTARISAELIIWTLEGANSTEFAIVGSELLVELA